MYAFESKVRYSEVGEDTRMTLYSVLNYFQDCSVFHSESVGRGTAVQEELGRAWVLTGWQIEFRRAADLGESIRISTWPHGFRGFVGERNFLMETLDGEVLACADSSWAYIDVKTGHPVKASEEERAAYPRTCFGHPDGIDKAAIGSTDIHRTQFVYEFDCETLQGRGLLLGEKADSIFL